MLNRLCLYFVELVRNTPLLIQLFFWYFAVVLQLPPLRKAANLYGALASRQGIYIPSFDVSPHWPYFWWGVLASIAVLVFCGRKPRRKTLPAGIGVLVVGWAAASVWLGMPLGLDFPVALRFRASGGLAFSPEFAAILLALVVN